MSHTETCHAGMGYEFVTMIRTRGGCFRHATDELPGAWD